MALLWLYFLMTHFSIPGCVVTLASIIYILLSSYVLAKTSPSIISCAGRLLGATVFDFTLVTLFFSGALIDIDIAVNKMFVAYGLAAGLAVLFCILRAIHKKSSFQRKPAAFIAKYLLLGVAAVGLYRIIVADFLDIRIISLVAVYIIVSAFIEQLMMAYAAANTSGTAFYQCFINIAVWSLAGVLCPYEITEVASKVTSLYDISFSPGGVAVAVLIFSAVGVYSWIADSKTKSFPNDCKLCLALAVGCVLIPVILATYTPYCVISFIAFGILCFVLFFGATGANKYVKIAHQNFLKLDVAFAAGSLALGVCQAAFIHGELFSALILCFGAVLGVLLHNFKSGKNGFLFWAYITAAYGVYLGEAVHRSYNCRTSYILLVFAVAVSVLALAIVNVKNKNKFTADVALKSAIVICSCLVMTAGVTNYGVRFGVTVDDAMPVSRLADDAAEENGVIRISLKPRGKGNKVTKCRYYWNDGANEPIEVKPDKNNQFSIPKNNGELRIFAEDGYGVSSQRSQWFYFK